MDEKKPWWKSRTLWWNVAMAMLTALEANFGYLQKFLPVSFYTLMACWLPIMNAGLRIITSQGLSFK